MIHPLDATPMQSEEAMSTTIESDWENTRLKERIEQLEAERDKLREQVKMLRIAMENAWQDGYCFCGAEGLSDAQKQFQRAFAATEQNP